MGNCLITTLKSVINNNSLLKVGEFKVFAKGNSTNHIIFGAYGPFTISAPLAVLSTSQGSSTGVSEIEIPADNTAHNIYLKNGVNESIIKIYNKYNIKQLYFQTIEEDVDLTYFTGLQELKIYGNVSGNGSFIGTLPASMKVIELTAIGSKGFNAQKPRLQLMPNLIRIMWDNHMGATWDIAEMVPCIPNVTKLDLIGNAGENVYGNFSELGKLASLTYLRGTAANSGSLEGFVANARTAGKTTGQISLYWIGVPDDVDASKSKVTFNGSGIYRGGTEKVLSWTATTITFDGVTITA